MKKAPREKCGDPISISPLIYDIKTCGNHSRTRLGTLGMMQILFRIPVYTSFTPEGIPVYGFGMMLFIAFIVCTWLAGKRAVAKGIEAQIVHDLSVWIFVAGLLGARTLFLYEQKLTVTEFLMNFPVSGMVVSFSMAPF